MKCRCTPIYTLFYADIAVIFATDEKLKRSEIGILVKWCKKWSVQVNVEQYRVMHMRKKGIALVENYQYWIRIVHAYIRVNRVRKENSLHGLACLS